MQQYHPTASKSYWPKIPQVLKIPRALRAQMTAKTPKAKKGKPSTEKEEPDCE
jgi:hypothetical protein